MTDLVQVFLSMLVFFFGIFCLVFGAFTAYFGTGRSRSIGGGLCLFGIVGLILVLWFTNVLPFAAPADWLEWDMDLVVEGIIAVVGAIIGVAIALGMFLGAIMKS